MQDEKISIYKKNQEEYYTKRLDDYGPSIQADGWTTDKLATLLYEQVDSLFAKEISKDKKFSILDVGSGNGYYYKYLEDKNWFELVDYHGLEIFEKSYEASKKLNPDAQYYCGEFLSHDFGSQKFDFVVSIGALAVNDYFSHEEMEEYTQKFLRKMFSLSNNGIALLSVDNLIGDQTVSKLVEYAFRRLSPMLTMDTAYFSDYFALSVYKKIYAMKKD